MLIKRLYSVFKNTFSDMDNLIAVCQITSTANKEKNYQMCKALITNAHKCGAKMVFIPESFDYIEEDKAKALEMAESLDGSLINSYKSLAKSLNIWLSLGGFHEKFSDTKLRNTHLVINNEGEIAETYHKIHLYDVQIPSKNIQAFESSLVEAGTEISPPVKTPIGNVGLAICYDMRFSQMAIALAENGADILTYPSAFFFGTGAYHWEILLRARAVETQSYVIAAAQTGSHSSTRKSWGHSLVVDPLGTIIAQCSEEPGFVLAPIDLSLIKTIRQEMPLECHRRYDIYPKMISSTLCKKKSIEDFYEFKFGSSIVKGLQVFYKTQLCLAFTNIKCVLPGHVLVAPLRAVEKLTDLSKDEVGDLFLAVQKVQKIIEEVHNTNSSSIVIQDGQHAGQTIKHVHVHIIPRKCGDFLVNDDIYRKLQNEKDCKNPKRSDDEMGYEALFLRSFF
ncbi:deaminated glutathione amidase [Aphis gossypii]|uniref:deaminated glutathione amidase n=1 Tax=Aphis gossypii TaxID=80765 RepID=UPI0021591221|nr:deaminated glutathione amidase [Aphis gossypii]XP_027849947.2 deaminated glutathione amidase [Aphis gossypii]XP_027849948.2 deaminated glutathione amidase [Aphis gossypii]